MSKNRLSKLKIDPIARFWSILDNMAASIVLYLLLLLVPVIGAWFTDVSWEFWAVIVISVLAISVFVFRVRKLKSALNTMTSITDLDGSILVLMPKLVSSSDKETAMQQLLREFLRDTTKVFGGQVSRALIVRPDPNDSENYLIPWVGYQMPEQTLSSEHRFYIGSDLDKKTGIAGNVFKSLEPVIVHFIEKIDEKTGEKSWAPDDPDYVVFDYDRPYPPYRSFVGVPILGSSGKCLGVLCFDSYNPRVFDSLEIQNLLGILGRRIAAAMLIYGQLR